MAYVSQELKKELAPKIKEVLKKYGMKATIGVHHHSTLCVRIKAGKLPMIENFAADIEDERRKNSVLTSRFIDVNPYHFRNHFTGKCKQFLIDLFAAMNKGNHDNSDIMTDYFDVGWYTDVRVGDWNRPYEMVK